MDITILICAIALILAAILVIWQAKALARCDLICKSCEILSLLRRGPMAAGDIAAHFEVSGATISHHLSVLRDAGLVLDDKQGKYIYYELNMSVVDEILEWISALKGDGRNEKNQ